MSEDKRDHLISVLIADDEPGMRLILRKKIQATDGFFVAGEAVTGDEAMTLYDKLNPQVVSWMWICRAKRASNAPG